MSVEELAVQLVATREKIRASRALYSVCKKLALRRSCIVFFFGAIRRSVFVCVCVFWLRVFVRGCRLVVQRRRLVAVSVSEFFPQRVSFVERQMAWPAARVS